MFFRFQADDLSGLPVTAPGIEYDRDLISKLSNWEGEGLPAPPGDNPEMHDPYIRANLRLRQFIVGRFYTEMLPH